MVLALVVAVLALPFRSATAFDLPIHDFTLANGLRVIVLPNARTPLITHSIWYKVGSAEEVAGKTGLAHFLEHLMFKGTAKFPGGAFDRVIKENGAVSNAFTTADHTMYFVRIHADRLEMIMQMEADRMQNLVLTEAETVSERDVVRQERLQRIENDPTGPFWERVVENLYGSHPYARPVIGDMADVEKLTKEDALAFYRTHYQPQNAVLVIAGNTTVDAVRVLAERYFGGLKNAVPAPNYQLPAAKQLAKPAKFELVDTRVQTPAVSISFLVPGSGSKDLRESIALGFLADVIAGSQDSPLPLALSTKAKRAASVGAYAVTSTDADGQFNLYAVPNPGVGLDALEAELWAQFETALEKELTQEALDRVRNRALRNMVHELDQPESLIRTAGTSALLGQKTSEFFDTALWMEITVADLKAVAGKYLTHDKAVTSLLLRNANDRTGAAQ